MIGSALVGTFLGILLAWRERAARRPARAEGRRRLEGAQCIKTTLLASMQGYAPQVAVEFERKVSTRRTDRPSPSSKATSKARKRDLGPLVAGIRRREFGRVGSGRRGALLRSCPPRRRFAPALLLILRYAERPTVPIRDRPDVWRPSRAGLGHGAAPAAKY
jgi:hypothetical protein